MAPQKKLDIFNLTDYNKRGKPIVNLYLESLVELSDLRLGAYGGVDMLVLFLC